MIVAPQPFVLSAIEANNYIYPRIGYANYLRGLPIGSFSASSFTDTGPADSIARPDTYTYWEIPTLPATCVIDYGRMVDLDFAGLAGHTLGSCGASILFETSLDGMVWDQFSDTLIPAHDGPIMFLDEIRQASFLRITVGAGAGTRPKIGVVYTEKALVMERVVNAPYVPVTMARDTVLKGAMSEGGQFLGQSRRRNGMRGSISFKFLSANWVRDHFDPFCESAISYPYFIAWNPELYPFEVGYCWSDKDIRPTYMGQIDLMQVDWEMRGVGRGVP